MGRRHSVAEVDMNVKSTVDKAFDAIRKVASNASIYKLDLKNVFKQFDSSGDGFLSIDELANAFLAMGVQLDGESLAALWKWVVLLSS